MAGVPVSVLDGLRSRPASSEWFVQWELEGQHDFVKCDSAKAALEWINNQ
jgi:hypothetical protein